MEDYNVLIRQLARILTWYGIRRYSTLTVKLYIQFNEVIIHKLEDDAEVCFTYVKKNIDAQYVQYIDIYYKLYHKQLAEYKAKQIN